MQLFLVHRHGNKLCPVEITIDHLYLLVRQKYIYTALDSPLS